MVKKRKEEKMVHLILIAEGATAICELQSDQGDLQQQLFSTMEFSSMQQQPCRQQATLPK